MHCVGRQAWGYGAKRAGVSRTAAALSIGAGRKTAVLVLAFPAAPTAVAAAAIRQHVAAAHPPPPGKKALCGPFLPFLHHIRVRRIHMRLTCFGLAWCIGMVLSAMLRTGFGSFCHGTYEHTGFETFYFR